MTTFGDPGVEAAGPAHPLDNPVRASLLGPHAHFALRRGRVLRYPVDVTPFVALPDHPEPADWADLALLAGPGGMAGMAGVPGPPPDDWEVIPIGAGVQLVAGDVRGAARGQAIGDIQGAGDGSGPSDGSGPADGPGSQDGEVVRLGPGDRADMLGLAGRTRPGPFLARTGELGTFVGIRRGGALVAMAGERLHPPGWTEISAVCTDGAWRGHGFATRLMRVLMAGIRARGETPFLHALASNSGAVRLYEAMGFRLRRTIDFTAVRVPGGGPVSVPPPPPEGPAAAG